MLSGRDAERSVIGELLEGARRSRSGVLVIRGEPGVGKSALLRDAGERAGDMRVLSASGVESEAQLPFAGLHQLLLPALEHLDALPEPQANALRVALGLEGGGAADRFLVYLATLTLLAEAAEPRPLLCLVDDAQWLDDASSEALTFVARRLQAEGIVLLFAAREGEARRFDVGELPELRLGGLDAEAAATLLDRSISVTLSPSVRSRLVEGTGGNPLALLELPSALSEAQLSGAEPVFDPLPVGERLEREFVVRVARLPEDTQTLLLVAAVDDTGRLAVLIDAARRLGAGVDSLDAAERAELARVQGQRFELRHPLLRSAVYQAAPLSRRQAAHEALADALAGEADAHRRAWHRVAASTNPDPAAVEELEEAARRAQGQSAYAAASLAFQRAGTLTPAAGPRVRRLTAAAENAWWAGQPERASTLLGLARSVAEEPGQRAEIDRWQGLIEWTTGVPADACRLLTGAAEAMAPRDSGQALYLLSLAGLAATSAGDAAAAVEIAGLANDLAVDETPFAQLLLHVLTGQGALYAGDFATAAPVLRRALELAEELDDDPVSVEPPVPLLFAGRAALFLGDDEAAYRLHQRAAAKARSRGTLGVLTQVLPRLGHAEVWAGRWRSASATAREGLELAREVGQENLSAHLLVVLALIAALRGDEEECRSLAVESRGLATGHRLTFVEELADWALLLLDLGLGQAGEALGHARRIAAPPGVQWAGPERIEAAIRAGEPETASGWLESFAAWAEASAAPWAQAACLHCRALLADDAGDATELFSAALEAHARAARPFERARTELALGESLRRARRRVEAREHLRAALDGFETLGAKGWAERARVELRASGQTARRRDPSTLDQLTAQEVQIAGLVAEGLTNREVAAQLFLSPRTIDFHLRNVFRKLGIASRTELARLDLDAPSGESPGGLAGASPGARS